MANTTLSRRLVYLLKATKTSQADLGKHVGVHRQTIADYAAGRRDPTSETVAKIARFFDVTSDWLVGLNDQMTPALPVETQIIIRNKTGLSRKSIYALTQSPTRKVNRAAVNALLENIKL